jgi:hypothetical protein
LEKRFEKYVDAVDIRTNWAEGIQFGLARRCRRTGGAGWIDAGQLAASGVDENK